MANPKLLGELRKRLADIREAHLEAPAAAGRFDAEKKRGAAALPALAEKTRSDDPSVRRDALFAIGALHGEGHVTEASIRAALDVAKKKQSLDDEMQAALFAIGKSRHKDLVHGYCEVLGSGVTDAVAGACIVLGYARWAPAVEYLKFVVNEAEPRAAQQAVWALGQIGSTDALPTLHHQLMQGRHLRWTPGALGDIGDPSSLELLLPVLKDPHPDVRFLAIAAIRAIVEKHARAPAFKQDAAWMIPELKTAASADSHAPTQVFALVVLAELGAPLTEEHVRTALGLDLSSLFTSKESFYLSRGAR